MRKLTKCLGAAVLFAAAALPFVSTPASAYNSNQLYAPPIHHTEVNAPSPGSIQPISPQKEQAPPKPQEKSDYDAFIGELSDILSRIKFIDSPAYSHGLEKIREDNKINAKINSVKKHYNIEFDGVTLKNDGGLVLSIGNYTVQVKIHSPDENPCLELGRYNFTGKDSTGIMYIGVRTCLSGKNFSDSKDPDNLFVYGEGISAEAMNYDVFRYGQSPSQIPPERDELSKSSLRNHSKFLEVAIEKIPKIQFSLSDIFKLLYDKHAPKYKNALKAAVELVPLYHDVSAKDFEQQLKNTTIFKFPYGQFVNTNDPRAKFVFSASTESIMPGLGTPIGVDHLVEFLLANNPGNNSCPPLPGQVVRHEMTLNNNNSLVLYFMTEVPSTDFDEFGDPTGEVKINFQSIVYYNPEFPHGQEFPMIKDDVDTPDDEYSKTVPLDTQHILTLFTGLMEKACNDNAIPKPKQEQQQ